MSLSTFEVFLKSLKAHSLLDASISKSAYVPLDLSIHNLELSTIDVSSSKELEQFIFNYIKTKQAKVAYGGYLEKRTIYQRSTYFNQQKPKHERNIHLGLDLWIEAKTPIFAPLAGTIHSFKNNMMHGDYGPTVILKHEISSQTFYTLYGHLSIESIADKHVGVEVKQGEQLATLGTAAINGDYPPHLHFQIIKTIGDYLGDYIGVSNQVNLEVYRKNCPDPNLLLELK